ncbi:phage tail assembly chaperone [Shewanella sp.]|uniref:phage tail assembly chaperone n=1 Tax=Shewanella sp. TaxID=50422 RepID=UPI003F3DB1F7
MDINALQALSATPPDSVWMALAEDGEIVGYYLDDASAPFGSILISAEQWQQQVERNASHYRDGAPAYEVRERDAALAYVLERQWRDNELSYTDRFMLADYPICSSERQDVISYRQALRDMPDVGWAKPAPPMIIARCK